MSIALGALNTTAISYGMLEKMAFSGSGDPGNTILAIGNKIRGVSIVPVEYGSANNQAATIQAAINAASDGDVLAFGSGVVKIETGLTCTKNISIIGNRTIWKTTSNITILTWGTASEPIIEGIFFEGNNTGAAQTGLIMNSNLGGYTINNCRFININNTGLAAGGTGISPYQKGSISNCRAITCAGIGMHITSAYVTMNNCDAPGCGKGIVVSGGNTTIVGSNADGCTVVGLELNAGPNTGKLTIVGGHFNHGNGGITINSADNGVVLQGVQSVTSLIEVNADRVHFIGCELASTGQPNMNSRNLLFMGCIIINPGMTLQNKTNCVFVNNYDLSNALWTG